MQVMKKYTYLIMAISLPLMLTSCATISEIQNSELAKTAGSFQFGSVQPNCYWYDGTNYEYNEYNIEITSKPCRARIKWNNKHIGDTPFVYAFSGIIEKGERVTLTAVPYDETLKSQEASLKVRTELPRKIDFDFTKQE